MNSSSLLSVAVVGLGVGEQHALTYVRHPECQLKWLYDYSPEQAKAVLAKVGQGGLADQYDVILDDPEIDIVSIASYDHLHYQEVIEAFRARKNVFVEKPLCRTLDELRELKKVWIKHDKPHVVSNLVLREAEVYRWLFNEIQAGTLGEIYAIDGDYLYGRLPKITEGWRNDVPDYSVMEGGGVHIIDLMMMMAQERPSTAHTLGNKICTRDTSFRYNDFMTTTFEFPSGIIGRVSANFGCVHRHHHVLRVFGTKASFIYDDMGPRLHSTRDEKTAPWMLNVATLPDGKGVLIPQFIASILNNDDPTPAAEREFDLIAVCAAADRSQSEQKTVEIVYP